MVQCLSLVTCVLRIKRWMWGLELQAGMPNKKFEGRFTQTLRQSTSEGNVFSEMRGNSTNWTKKYFGAVEVPLSSPMLIAYLIRWKRVDCLFSIDWYDERKWLFICDRKNIEDEMFYTLSF